MVAFNSALASMNAASGMAAQAAERIAAPPGGPFSDVTRDVVALRIAKAQYTAAGKVARTADEMTKTLINMFA